MGGTMYENTSRAIWDAYAAHLSGRRDGVFGVVSGRPLDDTAARALENSARKLGYGDSPCVFFTLRGADAASAGGGQPLDAAAVFEVIEGIDPIVLVAADSDAARALSDAYRCEVAPMKRSRVFGRTTVAFRSFEDMLASPQEKQAAWALLKQL